jgi:preprotein translocase subunit SecA
MPGTNFLFPIYLDIWRRLNRIELDLSNQKYYLIDLDDNSKREEIKSRDHLTEVLAKKMRSRLDRSCSTNSTPNFEIPANLKDYVNKQLHRWIESALVAKYKFIRDFDYIVVNSSNDMQCIVPVDYETSGQIQPSTNWGDGLHQFIQIKERTEMSPETLTSNFLSYISFFQRFFTNNSNTNKQRPLVLGLTGTLGNENDTSGLLNFLRNDVDLLFENAFIIPKTHDDKEMLVRYAPQWNNADDKSMTVKAESALRQARKGRAVLVLCKSIYEVDRLEEFIREHRAFSKGSIVLKKYTMNDDGAGNDTAQAMQIETVAAGEIVLSTLLASRGTDIRTTDQVESAGGLHVIVTFLPTSTRQKQQIEGRTARQGKVGSVEYILDMVSYFFLN